LNWECYASSDDGSKLAASFYQGNVITSDDFGRTWVESTFVTLEKSLLGHCALKFTQDNTLLLVVGNTLYFSASLKNRASATSWTKISNLPDGTGDIKGIAASADGDTIAFIRYGWSNDNYRGQIGVSHDAGQTWKSTTPDNTIRWSSITMSDNGARLAACGGVGNIWRSTDSGDTWTEVTSTGEHKDWEYITSSSNGMILAASVDKHVWRSADYGLSWIRGNDIRGDNIISITSSSNAMILTAITRLTIKIGENYDENVYAYGLQRSHDGGKTWGTCKEVSSFIVLSSSDGFRLLLLGKDYRRLYKDNSILTGTFEDHTRMSNTCRSYSHYHKNDSEETYYPVRSTQLRLPMVAISFGFLFIFLIIALIATKFKAKPEMLDNNVINAQQTDPKHIISKSRYEWVEVGLNFKMLIGRNNKIEVTANGGNCFQKCCCPTTKGGVYHISDVKYVQTTMQSPFVCFAACGDSYGWTIQKYVLVSTHFSFKNK